MHKTLEIWGISLAISGIVLSILGIFFRLTNPARRKKKAELFLCIMSAAMLWHVFMFLIILTGWILQVPNLYNKGIPFYYLIAPCAYLASRYTLFPKEKLHSLWWLHLLPFLIALIDIIPYALASSKEKYNLLKLVVSDLQMGFNHSYGFIEQKWHYIIKFLLAFCYLMAQWRLLYLQEEHVPPIDKKARTYILSFTALYSPHLLLQGSVLLNIFFNIEQGSHIIRDAKQLIWVSIFYFTFSMWMLFSAKTLSWKQFRSTRLWIQKK